ncbi:hypothetical protein L950_0225340 [Sphingobacterium sp. IITKGP-BTPF85]|nr:hypothetical protein L950_0225340 [Sphingobacterium sp. IITKGP-BTPF85]
MKTNKYIKYNNMLLQLKIQIKNITKPPVWRRLLVPDYFTFDRLHKVIQEAFGWENYHLYQFSPKGLGSYPEIAIIDEEWDEGNTEDAEKKCLKRYLKRKDKNIPISTILVMSGRIRLLLKK